MIDDASQWKNELVRVADRLESKTKQRRWTERTGVLIERDFVAAAYAMRKLTESGSVPDAFRQHPFPVRTYALTGAPPDPRSPDDIADLYDFDNGRRSTLSVVDLCQTILGSTVFTVCCGESADLFDGAYVSCDRHRKHVHLILASDFIALCCDVAV
jgi:hypothetical protein